MMRRCLSALAVIVLVGGAGSAAAQTQPAISHEQCLAAAQQLNAAVLDLERELSGAKDAANVCRSERASAAAREQAITEDLHRCNQVIDSVRADLDQVRGSLHSCEVDNAAAARAHAEEQRRLAARATYLAGQLQAQGTDATPDRDAIIASLNGGLDKLGTALGDAARALATVADRVGELASAPATAAAEELAALREQLNDEGAKRDRLEKALRAFYLENQQKDAALKTAREEIERLQRGASAAVAAAPECPPAAGPAATGFDDTLSQCRASLEEETHRVAALVRERDQLRAGRTAPPPVMPGNDTVATTNSGNAPPTTAAPVIDCAGSGGEELSLRAVPAGTYRLVDVGLGDLVERTSADTVTIAAPLCLMTRGVTVAEIGAFIAAQPESERERLGLRQLERSLRGLGDPGAAATGLTWTVAEAYARWKQTATGRRFDLPERADWLAAVAAWWPDRAADEQAMAATRDLLSGRYDWTATGCGATGDRSKRTLVGRADGRPPSGGIRDLCRDKDFPSRLSGLRLKVLP